MSCISINLKKEETLVKIEDNATEEEIIGELKIKLAELTKLYQEEKTPIRVTGKILSEQELQDVRNIVKEYLDVQINFNTPTSLGLHSIVRSYKEKIENSDTIFQRGSVRSGKKIEAKGTVVIIGDVNAGAEVIAGDNIIVQGNLRGLAHAGAKGNKKAIIAAASIECKQIRIANIIKEMEDEYDEEGNLIIPTRKTYASVEEEKIVLE